MNGSGARRRACILVVVIAAAGCGAPPGSSPSTTAAPGSAVPALEATIPELQRAMADGRLTSLALVDRYLERIAAYDESGPGLGAFIYVDPHAREVAAELDAERAESGARGALHGIPVVVKDNIDTADMPTTAGSAALAGFVPPDDAFQVAKLRQAGAVILGKANLCEFATCWQSRSTLGGQTLDPYDPQRDPGGSSGGTAVAVAAEFAAAGLGTDTCGSVRLPAAHGGIYGLRPTRGLSSRAGVIPFSPTLDEVGPMARNIIDLAVLLDATVGLDPADPTTVATDHAFVDAVRPDGLAGRRIGVLPFAAAADADDPLRAALDEMAANGATMDDVVLPPSPITALPYFDEFRFALAEYLAARPGAPARSLDEILESEPFDAAVTPRLRELAAVAGLDEDLRAQTDGQRGAWRDTLTAFLDDERLDAIAYPASTSVAARVGDPQDYFDCTISALTGLPAIVVPAGFTSDGLPVGLELVGRPFDESVLIAIAAGFEATTDHRRLPPTTPPLTSAG